MKRNKFSLSNYRLTSLDQGKLVPIGMYEVLPGDTIQQSTSALVRMAPLVTPVMHPVHLRIHHWFVPNRLIWDDWEKFITGGADGLDASVYPTFSSGAQVLEGSLEDYLGIPILDGGDSTIVRSALPMRAYMLIWNEWYRDQDLSTAAVIDTTSGPDSTTSKVLKNVAWGKDYFTTCRPWTQKGTEVSLPLGTVAPVVSKTGVGAGVKMRKASDDALLPSATAITTAADSIVEGDGVDGYWDPNGTLEANLAGATAATINDIREAFALQKYKEARARYGSRYVEYLRYLGVKSSDARLQRPEYLGGGRQTIQFSEVLQTGVNFGDNNGVGELRGHGIAAMRSNRYRKFFEEHGIVMSFISALPVGIYAQGYPRMYNRATKEDYFQKELEGIGQQEVYNREIMGSHATPAGVFGYQDRYDEYRRAESMVTGEFRETLNTWHMARIFSSDPSLNSTFVEANPTNRIYAATANHQMYVMAHHSVQARRMLRKTGTAGGV